VGGQRHVGTALLSGQRPGAHCTGDWVGPGADLDGHGKSRPPPGFYHQTVQPVASLYTDIDACFVFRNKPRAVVLQFTQYHIPANGILRRICQIVATSTWQYRWLTETVLWRRLVVSSYTACRTRAVCFSR